MITEAAVFLRDEIQRYLIETNTILNQDQVVLGNIAALETQDALSDKLVLSLVNMEEESTLKNGSNFIKNPTNNTIESAVPPVYINIYVLFTSTISSSDTNIDIAYQTALHRISSVIEFFQAKRSFTLQNSPGFVPNNLDETKLAEIRLIPELFTLTFEQINHLWGSLGGKQSPFVLYKIRLIKIQSRITAETPHIENINAETKYL